MLFRGKKEKYVLIGNDINMNIDMEWYSCTKTSRELRWKSGGLSNYNLWSDIFLTEDIVNYGEY